MKSLLRKYFPSRERLESLERELRQEQPLPPIPQALHAEIMSTVTKHGEKPTIAHVPIQFHAIFRALAPAMAILIFCLGAGYCIYSQSKKAFRSERPQEIVKLNINLPSASSALQIKDDASTALVEPLSQELKLVSDDMQSAAKALLFSFPQGI